MVTELWRRVRTATAVARKAAAATLAVTQRHASSRVMLSAITPTRSAVPTNASSLLREVSVGQALALVIPRRSVLERKRHVPRTNTAMTARTAATDSNAPRASVHRGMSSAELTIRIPQSHRSSRLAPTAVFFLARQAMVFACSETRTFLTARLAAVAEANARAETAKDHQHGRKLRTGSETTRTLQSPSDVFLPDFWPWPSVVAAGAVFDDAWLVAKLRSDQP